jgi:V8-like Glu-specific endopeptidase
MRDTGATLLGLAMSACVCAACGSGTQTSPSAPVSPTSSVSPCSVIGGTIPISVDILHGTLCSPADSSVVLVNLRDKDNTPTGACSGTVIAPRAVLTAAHCLLGDTAAVRIYQGTGAEVPAASFQANPLYRASDSFADVGVVITTQDLNRVPIRLLTSRDARVGETAVLAGWGKDENGNGTILRAGTTTISAVDSVLLQTQYNSVNSSVCSGDSGGPLLLSEGGVWAVAGVTSASTAGGSCALGVNYYGSMRNPTIMSFIFGLVPAAGRQ